MRRVKKENLEIRESQVARQWWRRARISFTLWSRFIYEVHKSDRFW